MSNLIKFEMPKFCQEKCISVRSPHHFHRINHRHFCSVFHLMQYAAAATMIFRGNEPSAANISAQCGNPPPTPTLYRKFPEFPAKILPPHKILPEILFPIFRSCVFI